MNDSDKRQFLEIMNGLADIFSANLTQTGVKMRFEALKQYDIGQIIGAANIVAKTRKYTTMPVPADFITAIEGDPEENADIQKSIVMSAIKHYNPDQKFEDPITHDIIFNRIGWHKIGQTKNRDIPFILMDFKNMYLAYNKAASGNVLNAPLEIRGLIKKMTKEIE